MPESQTATAVTSIRAGATSVSLNAWVVLGIWTVPALLSTFETVMFSRASTHPMPVWLAFASEAPQWYGWALLTPVIFWLAWRFSLERPRRVRNVLIHVGAALAASVVVAFGDAIVNAWARPSTRTIPAAASSWFISGLPAMTVAYFAIVILSYTLGGAARLRERERAAAALETQLRDAQLSALRMQLQPHFLFNSLNAVMALVRDQDTASAVRALSLLSDVLRVAINAGDAYETTLAEELDFVGRYLEIERVRFGERLRVTVDVQAGLGASRVPTFILQPFVENSLKHGVLRERAGNEIVIEARRDGPSLKLSVRDDGRGLPNSGAAPAGVGISNARARLERMYGDRATLSVANAAGGRGVAVDITLPAAP